MKNLVTSIAYTNPIAIRATVSGLSIAIKKMERAAKVVDRISAYKSKRKAIHLFELFYINKALVYKSIALKIYFN